MLDQDVLIARYAIPDRTTPHLRVNFIASLDGAATHDGVSGPLNNPDDKQVFDTLRMLSDVVLVGAGTVRKEGYGAMRLDDDAATWRLAHGLPAHPRFAIVSSRLDLDPASPIFTDAPVRPIVVTHAEPTARTPESPPSPSVSPAPSPPASNAGLLGEPGPLSRATPRSAKLASLAAVADVLACGETALDPHAMVAALADAGLPQILCEGGPHLLGALIEADAVDELCLTLAPVLEGGAATRITAGHAQRTREMHLAHVFPAGHMLFLRYLRAR